MTAYWELLRDPRWQKKRLEVMDREAFTCQECRAPNKTLNVHHTYYSKGRKPWEYPDDALQCLCEDCHAATEGQLKEIREAYALTSRSRREMVLGFVRAASVAGDPEARISVENLHIAIGVGGYFCLDPTDVLAMCDKEGTVVAFELWKRHENDELRTAHASAS